MTFMISKESDNVQSITEIQEAFRAIVADREKPFVTREELSQVSERNIEEHRGGIIVLIM